MLFPYSRGSGQFLGKCAIAIHTSQAWISLSRGKPKNISDPPCLFFQALYGLQHGIQMQPLGIFSTLQLLQGCISQQRSHLWRRTEETETIHSRSLPCLVKDKGAFHATHAALGRKSSVLSKWRQGAQKRL